MEHVGKLAALGIDSLKIEARTKSHCRVAHTAQVYRRAIDDAVAGKPFNPERLLEVVHPGGHRVVQLDAMRNQDGGAIEVAQGSPIRVWVPLGASTNGALIAADLSQLFMRFCIQAQNKAGAADRALARRGEPTQ